ncbi:MAG: hypothetical protein QOH96_3395 [Blastocatellia bacterium]|jgi:hypothetical protein|nr:hypothetical protein [Blastocatellia bacterium]
MNGVACTDLPLKGKSTPTYHFLAARLGTIQATVQRIAPERRAKVGAQ